MVLGFILALALLSLTVSMKRSSLITAILVLGFATQAHARLQDIDVAALNFKIAADSPKDTRIVFFDGYTWGVDQGKKRAGSKIEKLDPLSDLAKCVIEQQGSLKLALQKNETALSELKVLVVNVRLNHHIDQNAVTYFRDDDPTSSQMYVDVNFGTDGKCYQNTEKELTNAIQLALSDKRDEDRKALEAAIDIYSEIFDRIHAGTLRSMPPNQVPSEGVTHGLHEKDLATDVPNTETPPSTAAQSQTSAATAL